MSTVNCKKCGQNFSDEHNFCPNCGEQVPTVTYCRNCGNRVENQSFCTACGYSMDNQTPNYNQMNNYAPNYNNQMPYPMEKPTSGMAIASMVLGILSFLCFGIFTAIPAIILGFVSLRKIDKGMQTGKGYAITGIITGIIQTIFTIIVAIIVLVPLFFVELPEETKQKCCDSAHGELKDNFCYSDNDDYDLSEYYTCIINEYYEDK